MRNHQNRYAIEMLAEELEVELSDIAGLYKSYFEEMQGEISEMQEFLSRKNWYMLERTVHNIKGVSANLKMDDIFEEAENFDRLLKNHETNDAETHVQKLIILLRDAELEVKGFFEENGLLI